MTHDLDLRRTGAGRTVGECACGDWVMKVDPDALAGQARSLEEIVERAHARHLHDAAM